MAELAKGPDLSSWWSRRSYLRLIGESCPGCEEKIFPPRDICPRCGVNTKETLSSQPEVIIYQAPRVEVSSSLTSTSSK